MSRGGALPLGSALILVALVAFGAALVAIDASATRGARTTADEPQYLLTALSIGRDFDLDISDELDGEEYRSFHALDLNPQTVSLDDSGQRISPHDPLLPALLAGPVRLGGWVGARAVLALVAATTAALTLWVAVRRFGVPVLTGAIVVAACFVAPPLVSYGSQIYPELPAALALLAGVGAATGSLGRRGLVLAGLAVVALPWLAVKYTPLAAVLAAAVLVTVWRQGRRRQAWAMAGLLGVAGLAYLLIHQRVYGGWTVYAAGDHFVGGEFEVVGSDPNYVGRTRRLAGLLVDRQFGLVAWAPAYLALVPALAVLIARRARNGPLLLGLLATGWATATWVALTMHGWWWPGRQVVVVLPLAVIAMATLAARSRAWLRWIALGGAVGFLGWLWLAFESSTGRLTLIVNFADTGNPLYQAWSVLLPDHMTWKATDVALTLMWIGVIALLTALTLRSLAPRSARSADGKGAGRVLVGTGPSQ